MLHLSASLLRRIPLPFPFESPRRANFFYTLYFDYYFVSKADHYRHLTTQFQGSQSEKPTMSSFPVSNTSAIVDPEDETADPSEFELDLDVYANDSSLLLPFAQDGTARTDTRTNEVIDEDGITSTNTKAVGTTFTTNTPIASKMPCEMPGYSSAYDEVGTCDDEQDEAEFRSFLSSTLLPSLSAGGLAVASAPHDNAKASPEPSSKPTEAFSIEKEQAEIASLTVDEILDAERDLTGLTTGLNQMSLQGQGQEKPPFDANNASSIGTSTNAQIHEDPIATSTDLAALELALLSLPPETKRYYLEACVRCPAEVTDERKAAFLETDQLDASGAAIRLCTYWTVRVSTFGADLAYLPMTLHGAMREDVDAMIRYCPMQRLPKPDAYGRQMTFWDSGRRKPELCTTQQEVGDTFFLATSLQHCFVMRSYIMAMNSVSFYDTKFFLVVVRLAPRYVLPCPHHDS